MPAGQPSAAPPDGLGQSAPSTATGALIARMESLLESIVQRLSDGEAPGIELNCRRSLRSREGKSRRQLVRVPGRTRSEGQKFARVLLILQLSHDALVSGAILTKRHIFYQHQDLFGKQRVVDELVDDVALTLGVSRDDLNIVASAKGLVSGPLTLRLQDGTAIDASLGDAGTPIPISRSILSVDCAAMKWILVIEKDATFRTLSSSRFWQTSVVGPGLLVTAKGYPDLATRALLHRIHEQRPEIPMLALTDFDPDGLNIFRCYRFGSDAMAHESAAYNPGMRWLGIKARHIQELAATSGDSPSSDARHASSSHMSGSGAASRVSISSTSCRDPICLLTARDRRSARCTLEKVWAQSSDDGELAQLRRELQVLLMMGVKAEIQWLDDAGNMAEWLEDNMAAMMAPEF